MKPILLLILTACLPASLLGAPQKLNLFIWSEYVDPAVLADFEQQFQCKVNVDLYEDVESMLAKVQGGGAGGYDVVVPTDHIVPAMVKLKLLAPLNRANIPNFKHLDPAFLNPPYDRGNQFTVPYQWGTLGVLARRDSTRPLPESWSIFFDPSQAVRPFLLIDSMRDLIGPALRFQNRSVNSVDPTELKAARDLLLAAKQRSLGFEGSVGAKNKILARAAQAAIVYSGEGVRAMNENTNTVYFIPREGSVIWVDSLAVLARAPNRELAETFINFVLEPKQGARISNFTQFSTPNQAAREFIKPADLHNPALYPPAEVRSRLEYLNDLGGKIRLYDEVWMQVKTK